MPSGRALLWASFIASTTAVVFDQPIDITLLGPIYLPAAKRSLQAWDDAVTQANAALNDIIQTGNSTYGPFDNQGTSFSASVFDLTTNRPLFDFHFEAPQLNGSYTKGKLTDNTIYRTGSLGKLLTMYAWMIDVGDSVFTDPITKYVVSWISVFWLYTSHSEFTFYHSLNLPLLLGIIQTLSSKLIGAK